MTFSTDKIRAKQRLWDMRRYEGQNVLLVYPEDGGSPQIVNLTTKPMLVLLSR